MLSALALAAPASALQIVGRVRGFGGPLGSHSVALPRVLVRVQGARGRVVAEARTGARGVFHVNVPATGRYTFSASDPHAPCRRTPVAIKRGTTVSISCSIK